MSVTVRVGESTATVKDQQWRGPDKRLVSRLRDATADYEPTAYDPWPDMTMAEMAIEQLGGKIVGQTKPPEQVPGRVY